jgi:hypothetical protein
MLQFILKCSLFNDKITDTHIIEIMCTVLRKQAMEGYGIIQNG